MLPASAVELLAMCGYVLYIQSLAVKWLFECLFTDSLLFTSTGSYVWEMGSENPEDFGPAVILADDDQQEIGGLINSDGEEVDFSDLSEQMNCI